MSQSDKDNIDEPVRVAGRDSPKFSEDDKVIDDIINGVDDIDMHGDTDDEDANGEDGNDGDDGDGSQSKIRKKKKENKQFYNPHSYKRLRSNAEILLATIHRTVHSGPLMLGPFASQITVGILLRPLRRHHLAVFDLTLLKLERSPLLGLHPTDCNRV